MKSEKEVTTGIERVGKWVGVSGKWFVADDVLAVLTSRPDDQDNPRCEVVFVLWSEARTFSIIVNASSFDVWKAVAGPATDNAVTLGASLGKIQEQP